MFQWMSKKFPKVRWFGSDKKEVGQSLVEMAIIVPLLAFIFVGLIEVGWAIRGYLVLLSTNRETTRYAARGDHLNFEGVNLDSATVGDTVNYNRVLTHTEEVLRNNELGLNLFGEGPENGAFIISHYLIEAGKPCDLRDDDLAEGDASCLKGGGSDCRNPADRKPDYIGDDVVLYPGKTGYDHFIYTQGISVTASRIDPVQLAAELKEENDALNCMIIERGLSNPTLSSNSVIVVEAFYDQPQLLGVPLLSNTFTDPIGLYNQTKMRITTAKFSQGGGCELMPIAIKEDVFQDPATGQDYPEGTFIPDIRNGGGTGNFGWLGWNSDVGNSPVTGNSGDSQRYLEYGIQDLALAMNDYIEPNSNPPDYVLNAGDKVVGKTGEVASANQELEKYAGQVVTVPVWEIFEGTGQGGTYTIKRFVMVQIQEVVLTGNPKYISAIFLGDDPNCPTSGPGGEDILGY